MERRDENFRRDRRYDDGTTRYDDRNRARRYEDRNRSPPRDYRCRRSPSRPDEGYLKLKAVCQDIKGENFIMKGVRHTETHYRVKRFTLVSKGYLAEHWSILFLSADE